MSRKMVPEILHPFNQRPMRHLQGIIYGGTGGRIINCSFSEIGSCIIINHGSLEIQNCQFSSVGYGIRHIEYNGNGGMEVLDCEFQDIEEVSLRTFGLREGFLRGSILDKGEHYVVRFDNMYTELSEEILEPELDDNSYFRGERYRAFDYTPPKVGLISDNDLEDHFDMTENWWGTTDPDSIQAWIFDGQDSPDVGVIIDWYPFKSVPVGNKKRNSGSLKALFR